LTGPVRLIDQRRVPHLANARVFAGSLNVVCRFFGPHTLLCLSEERGGKMSNFDSELDARGLNCPLPILRAKKALNELGGGQVLRILATDPGSVKDFQAFAKQTGNELVESSEANGEYVFLLKKKA
jgi:tRNA 2-thiouridine synthesizing protein A